MAVLVIGGSGRGAGKTAVGCALMAAMPEFRWVAVKVSPHAHGRAEGLLEETDRGSGKDTARYLAAGARRAFLVAGVEVAEAGKLVVEARGLATDCDALLVESNRISAGSVANRGERALTLAVLSGNEAEWKQSLRECAGGVDALVLGNLANADGFASPYLRKPVFRLAGGQWCVPELVRFVRARLAD